MRLQLATFGDILFGVACLVMIAAGGLQIRDRLTQHGVAPQAGAPPERVEDLTISTSPAIVKTTSTSSIALVEFADFQCPFCGEYAKGTYRQIQREFVDSGKIAYAFFNFPLENIHPKALRASEAAECAGQQHKFWEMHDLLFQNQDFAEQVLLKNGLGLGLELPQFEACLAGTTVWKIRQQMAVASAAGINSTPTLLIGQIESPGTIRVKYRFRGVPRYEELARTLKNALDSARGPIVSLSGVVGTPVQQPIPLYDSLAVDGIR